MLEKDMASEVAIELLHHAMKTRGFHVVCDYNKPDLTLYHLAASRGLVKFIQAILKEKCRLQATKQQFERTLLCIVEQAFRYWRNSSDRAVITREWFN